MTLYQRRNVVSELFETTCFSKLCQIAKNPPKNALFIFDIDEVLICARDQVLRPPHKEKWLYEYIDSRYPPEEAKHLSGYIWSYYETDLVDHSLPEIIGMLTSSHAYTIALTAGWNGRLGHLDNHCDIRVQKLLNYGLDFSKSFDVEGELFFPELMYCGKTASFKKGITFACMQPKHLVLEAFLKKLSFTPSEVHFIDDYMPNLTGMRAYCQEKGMNFYGYHYKGVEAREKDFLNERRAHFQYQTVLTTKKWLSDAEADEILRKHR